MQVQILTCSAAASNTAFGTPKSVLAAAKTDFGGRQN